MLRTAPIAALNHLLGQADWARDRLRPFARRSASIVAPPLALRFTVRDDGSIAAADEAAAPDVEIVLPPPTPMQLLAGRQAIFSGARISGAADFAEALGFVLRNLRWDYEEDLSRVVGDVAAHRLSTALGSFLAWNRQAATNAVGNVLEYLTEEQPALLGGKQGKAFARQLAALSDDLSRLETRIQRLAARK